MSVVPPQRQRGAVTLIGALFLIVVLIVLLDAVQRMAASDITDSALHNDGIEALFLAESGLERAAWRYATGSSCAALAGETDTAGRGEFEILSSAPAGTLCRVRVEGRVVTTTVANTVRRTVESDLERAAFLGWAVGEPSGGDEVLLAWDGSSWSQPGPYAAVPDVALNGVYCLASDDCWAVGDQSGGAANLNYWDGTTWSAVAAPAVPGVGLNSIYCVTSDDCWAVGDKNGNANNLNHWDGSSWSNISAPAVPKVDLYSVHCVAGDDCWAVGKKNGNASNLNHWDGGSWSNVAAPAVPKVDLNSVHCVAGNDCRAVGDKNGNKENLNHWDGFSWANITAPGVPNKGLASVSCVAGNDCWTAGVKSGGEHIDHWDGAAWNRAGPYAGVPNNDLHGVHMVSATEGYAVGDAGSIAAWDGSNWDGQASPVSTRLNAVAVSAGGGGGGVRLVRWTEVIQ